MKFLRRCPYPQCLVEKDEIDHFGGNMIGGFTPIVIELTINENGIGLNVFMR